jgi:hypothetical protein
MAFVHFAQKREGVWFWGERGITPPTAIIESLIPTKHLDTRSIVC